jgi:hypothetical protein
MSKRVRPLAVLLKGLALFALVNFAFALPIFRGVYSLSLYNGIIPGRYGFGDAANLDIMMATNRLSAPKQANEFRVFLAGDSSVAGARLNYRDKVVFLIDSLNLQTCDGKLIRAYNLGSPFNSFLKDAVILERAKQYQPDLIVEFVTLHTFTQARQFYPQVLTENLPQTLAVIEKYDSGLKLPKDFRGSETWWDATLLGQRGNLSAWLVSNLQAVEWAATDVDITNAEDDGQDLPNVEALLNNDGAPKENTPKKNPQNDPDKKLRYNGWAPPDLPVAEMRFDLFYALFKVNADLPLLVVNEPIKIQPDLKSAERYNLDYPYWAYDQYRQLLLDRSRAEGWSYLDLWDAVPEQYFSDSSFHRTPAGERIVADKLIPAIQALACP